MMDRNSYFSKLWPRFLCLALVFTGLSFLYRFPDWFAADTDRLTALWWFLIIVVGWGAAWAAISIVSPLFASKGDDT